MLGGLKQINAFQHRTNSFGTNANGEAVFAKGVLGFIKLIFVDQLAFCERGDARLNNDVTLKIEHLFNVLQRHIQHQRDTRWQGLQEPDVRNWGGKLNVTHTLTTHALKCDFHATLFAGYAFVFDALIFTAQALIILDRSKDTRTKETVAFWFERTVIDRLWLFNFAVRPAFDLIWAGKGDTDIVELWCNGLWAKDVHDVLIHGTFSPVLIRERKRSAHSTPRKISSKLAYFFGGS